MVILKLMFILVEGRNNIFVRAVDNFNNVTEETYPIVYKPK